MAMRTTTNPSRLDFASGVGDTENRITGAGFMGSLPEPRRRVPLAAPNPSRIDFASGVGDVGNRLTRSGFMGSLPPPPIAPIDAKARGVAARAVKLAGEREAAKRVPVMPSVAERDATNRISGRTSRVPQDPLSNALVSGATTSIAMLADPIKDRPILNFSSSPVMSEQEEALLRAAPERSNSTGKVPTRGGVTGGTSVIDRTPSGGGLKAALGNMQSWSDDRAADFVRGADTIASGTERAGSMLWDPEAQAAKDAAQRSLAVLPRRSTDRRAVSPAPQENVSSMPQRNYVGSGATRTAISGMDTNAQPDTVPAQSVVTEKGETIPFQPNRGVTGPAAPLATQAQGEVAAPRQAESVLPNKDTDILRGIRSRNDDLLKEARMNVATARTGQERALAIQGYNNVLAGVSQQEAQLAGTGLTTASGERVASAGLQATAADKAADRDMTERIAKIKTGLTPAHADIFKAGMDAYSADISDLQDQFAVAKKTGWWTSGGEQKTLDQITQDIANKKRERDAYMQQFQGAMQGDGLAQAVGQVKTVPDGATGKLKDGSPVRRVNGQWVRI